ncbi:unnamed protein product [Urochloa humidicola]
MHTLVGGVLCALLAVTAGESGADAQNSYVVYVAAEAAPRSSRPCVLSRSYDSFIRGHLPAHAARPAPKLLYTYAHAATGFAARLTAAQAAHLANKSSVLAVVPDAMAKLHTTRTPSFLHLLSPGAPDLIRPRPSVASNVVIGVIDSGIYPKDRASFAADPSLPPVPSKFRGRCVTTPSFNASAYCNRKLVGAKSFYWGYAAQHGELKPHDMSPLDTKGHGTHTASTAAGSAVKDAAFLGVFAKGEATGMAQGARIAVYKACGNAGCSGSDILEAFDEAIKDRVDVISMSIGYKDAGPQFDHDTMAVGAFSAVREGILVSVSAGNSGPREATASNVAPWMLTVGASTIDRTFLAEVLLGDDQTFFGTSLYNGLPRLGPKELVHGGDVGSSTCESWSLDSSRVAGKIVVCDAVKIGAAAYVGEAVKRAGGAGAILIGSKELGEGLTSTSHVLPAVEVTFTDGEKIKDYINTWKQIKQPPVATLTFIGTVVSPIPSSPRMASFSSRGPNHHAPEILKPDVTAPGVDILAAWTGERSPTGLASDQRRVHFNIMSGTSMACPHVSGIAALLLEAHPNWSPAEIKSALMTTAYNEDNAGNTIKDTATGQASTPFVRGAGHVEPASALDPGLVYSAGADDYISFLCALGYSPDRIAVITRGSASTDYCSERTAGSVGDLNYPAFSVVFGSDRREVTQRRMVRNVGSDAEATYTAIIAVPAGVRVRVEPPTLQFSATQRTHRYAVTFTPQPGSVTTDRYTFGSIVWSDGKHKVTSPIAITWPASSSVAAM